MFCNSLEISIRALEAQGAAIFNRRLLESGRFQTAPPWFFHVIPAPKITPRVVKVLPIAAEKNVGHAEARPSDLETQATQPASLEVRSKRPAFSNSSG